MAIALRAILLSSYVFWTFIEIFIKLIIQRQCLLLEAAGALIRHLYISQRRFGFLSYMNGPVPMISNSQFFIMMNISHSACTAFILFHSQRWIMARGPILILIFCQNALRDNKVLWLVEPFCWSQNSPILEIGISIHMAENRILSEWCKMQRSVIEWNGWRFQRFPVYICLGQFSSKDRESLFRPVFVPSRDLEGLGHGSWERGLETLRSTWGMKNLQVMTGYGLLQWRAIIESTVFQLAGISS